MITGGDVFAFCGKKRCYDAFGALNKDSRKNGFFTFFLKILPALFLSAPKRPTF
jgi:hypothetical protein